MSLEFRINQLIDALSAATKFMEDSPKLDFNEDRTLSWISVVAYQNKKLIEEVENCEEYKDFLSEEKVYSGEYY